MEKPTRLKVIQKAGILKDSMPFVMAQIVMVILENTAVMPLKLPESMLLAMSKTLS